MKLFRYFMTFKIYLIKECVSLSSGVYSKILVFIDVNNCMIQIFEVRF